jgi:hypothetical protein
MNIFQQTLHKTQQECIVSVQNIDFSLPWWRLFTLHKFAITEILVLDSVKTVITTLTPVLLVYAFENRSSKIILLVFGVLFAQYGLSLIKELELARIKVTVTSSVFVSANGLLMQTDPIKHQFRESGKLISVIDKGAVAVDGLHDIFAYGFLSAFISLITALILFINQDSILCLIALIFFGVSLVLAVIKVLRFRPLYFPAFKKEDNYEKISVENITQAPFIRSLFQTKFFLAEIQRKLLISREAFLFLWDINDNDFAQIAVVLQMGGVAFVAYCLTLIEKGSLSVLQGIALLAVYYSLSQTILELHRTIRKYIEAQTRVETLYNTINDYNYKTFESIK